MPLGLWRGVVVRVDDDQIFVRVDHLGPDSLFRAEPFDDVALAIGDGVLCGWFEGRAGQLELVRKLKAPVVLGALYTSTYGGTY